MKKRIEELADRFSRNEILLVSDFLSESEQAEVNHIAKRTRGSEFFGGFDGAERKVLLFLPEWEDKEDVLSAVRIDVKFSHSLTHRDYLGAILGLGIKREKIGDILVLNEGTRAYAITRAPMDAFLRDTLTSIGRFAAHVEIVKLNELELPERHVKHIKTTVKSMRLDSVAASAFSLSRSRMAEYIDAGLVSLNHEVCIKKEKAIDVDDVIAVRGLGRASVKALGAISKKDRQFVELERLV